MNDNLGTPLYQIAIDDRRASSLVAPDFLKAVICRILHEEDVSSANLSIALVTDAEIHNVNRRFLGHDYATDVISFLFNDPDEVDSPHVVPSTEDLVENNTGETLTNSSYSVDGELIISFETAIREADAHGWSPEAELLLYVVHGLLHLCGYDDLTDEARPLMRARERELLARWGFCPTGLEP